MTPWATLHMKPIHAKLTLVLGFLQLKSTGTVNAIKMERFGVESSPLETAQLYSRTVDNNTQIYRQEQLSVGQSVSETIIVPVAEKVVRRFGEVPKTLPGSSNGTLT